MGHSPLSVRRWAKVWSLTFCLNSSFAFMGALGLSWSALIGVVNGIIVCWGVGFGIGLMSERLQESLLKGGLVVALMQAFPVVHILAGLVAVYSLSILMQINRLTEDSVETYMAGFLLTILTAQPLITLALAIGYWRTRPVGIEPDDVDPEFE